MFANCATQFTCAVSAVQFFLFNWQGGARHVDYSAATLEWSTCVGLLFGALRYCWHYPKPDESLLFSTSDSRSQVIMKELFTRVYHNFVDECLKVGRSSMASNTGSIIIPRTPLFVKTTGSVSHTAIPGIYEIK